MVRQIMFANGDRCGDRKLTVWGRHGYHQCHGLDIFHIADPIVRLGAITSRRKVSESVHIDLPGDPDMLEKIAKSLNDLARKIRLGKCDPAATHARETHLA